MRTLVVKLGATGDVVRTTPVLRCLAGEVHWVTSEKNRSMLVGLPQSAADLRVFSFEERSALEGNSYDLAINLEDGLESAALLRAVRYDRLFGAYADGSGELKYTADARGWFDLSLISVYGREKADALKFQNRHTYQELLFGGLGWRFRGEQYLLPPTPESPLRGDVAIASEAGPVWPMKRWAFFDLLKPELERCGLIVNVLPTRPSLLEHLADVRNHRCCVSGDSLPMHLAMGSGLPCVGLFTCTSPWEIYDYGLLTKIISPSLGDFFYRRVFDSRATTAISLEDVLAKVLRTLT